MTLLPAQAAQILPQLAAHVVVQRVQVAAIGLAGENRVYMATIDHNHASASRGVGVIMGDKRLKAGDVVNVDDDGSVVHGNGAIININMRTLYSPLGERSYKFTTALRMRRTSPPTTHADSTLRITTPMPT